ncbi:MAG: hypothetical protein CSA36_02265 [Draconibacterium sp.]|nr:MAG: hypothetical protein CSA36_02265 [Draconibacterium sp.]
MILFYTEEITPRIEYITRLIFSRILQVKIAFTDSSDEFIKSELPKINYSHQKFGNELYIKPHRLMTLKALIRPNINPVWVDGEKYFCESSTDSLFPFDPFAASFYVVTRYEEYIEKKRRDKFGRYPFNESILHKYNLLKKPVVNIWADNIRRAFEEVYPDFQFPEKKFRFFTTIDIDNAWAYKNKSMFRTLAAMGKAALNGQFEEIKQRRDVLSGKVTDPYDTYDYIDNVFKNNTDKVKFFFLLGNYRKYDKNVSYKNKAFRDLVKRIASKYDIGVHPSYHTGKKRGTKTTKEEVKRLQKITGLEIIKSRQHFLRLRFPKTYRRLLKAGILEDYTMGYPNQTGFRAGICSPFNFYDLEKDVPTNLVILPFQAMDVTLHDYLQLPPEEAFEEIEKLMLEVKKVNGIFMSVWHNETINNLGTWEGYREVFEKMNRLGIQWANE